VVEKTIKSPTLKGVSASKSELVFKLRLSLGWPKVESIFQNNRDK